MFKITIEASDATDLKSQLQTMASVLGAVEQLTPVPKAKPAARRAPTPALEEVVFPDDPIVANDPVDAELLEVLEPAPNTANTVVDAGTGKPVVPDFEEPVKQMTFDDVKVAAAKLAQADTPALRALIEKYGGHNLTSIPKDKLGDFAGEVLAAVA